MNAEEVVGVRSRAGLPSHIGCRDTHPPTDAGGSNNNINQGASIMFNRRLLAILASGVLALPFAAQAADNCSGHFNNVSQTASTIEVGKDHTLTSFIFHSITNSDDSVNNGVGECSGYALTTPDGKTRMAGICARKLKDGGSFSDAWALEPGANRGTWKMAGGTGSAAGKSWSGWWEVVFDDGKRTIGKWGGNCN